MLYTGDPMNPQTSPTTTSTYRSARLVCGAILLNAAAMAVAGVLVVRLGFCPKTGLAPEVAGVLIPLGLAGTLASFPVRWLMLGRLGETGDSTARLRVAIAAMTLAEAGSIAGLAFALLTETLAASYLLWSVSLAACILHYPRAAWLTGPPETPTPR